jgi:hypothetical protein
MKKEQLEKGRELDRTINDYRSRINAAEAIDDERYTLGSIKMELQAKPKDGKSDYYNDSYGTGNTNIPVELREKVVEELVDCAMRIKRIFEKEIKKLEKEFESL